MMKRTLLLLAASSVALFSSAKTLTTAEVEAIYSQYTSQSAPSRVSVHDPSIVMGYEASDGTVSGTETSGSTKIYCVFGSHNAWAKSYDLQNWTLFTNNINTDYATIFADDASYSAHGGSSYDVSGNMWAPDVIWNPTMGKWCMYMSINGDYWYSSIVLLTADDLLGDWTRVGSVVFSFGNSSSYWTETDGPDITGESSKPDRYDLSRNSNLTYGMNCIDPCAFFDQEGNMWMTYGSWFGGLYILKLDASTGLRDTSYTYETTDGTAANATSDVYMGIKVAGGNNVSGEASYIQYFDGLYYLFVTYGGLTTTGGYNMRVFSSEEVTGPYYDLSGQDARYCTSSSAADITRVGGLKYTVGTKLMDYYKWDFQEYAQVAQGHNSAFEDEDGKRYVIYHTRFNTGNEGHEVRVRQLFKAANNGLVATPFEYSGETLATSAYSSDDIVGTYRVIYHTTTDYANVAYNAPVEIVLNSDGSVTGTYTGTWSQGSDSPAVTLQLLISSYTRTFYGYFVEQNLEETGYPVLCFTAVDASYDIPIWGYKVDEDLAVSIDAMEVSASTTAYVGTTFALPSTGAFGSTYTWKSNDTTAIDDEGNVSSTTTATQATFTLTVTNGDSEYTTTHTVSIVDLPFSADLILGTYATSDEYNEAAPTFSVDETTGASISFDVSGLSSDWDLIAHSTDNDYYHLLLSVLHLNGSDTYEAAATLSSAASQAGYTSSSAWTIFLTGSYFVTVSFNPDGTIDYYRDGELMLTFEASTSPSWSSSTIAARTPSQIAEAVIGYIANGQLEFDYSVTNIYIGYSLDYDPSPVTDIKADERNIKISVTSGNIVNITGKADDEPVAIYTLQGVQVYSGTESRIRLTDRGLYVVSVDGVRQKVAIK